MKLSGIAVSMMLTATTLALSACVTTADKLVQTVPVGAGTSRLPPLPFVACVKAKWRLRPLKIGEYSPNADGDVVTVHGASGQTMLLIDAEPSANGTGYTIYGDIVGAAAYVTDAHTCD
ncbi:hypothetical protein [Caballeronia sp.]|uniref:hypothetical protein n=1 Tax=Caballeronia sp. TaxID=1931223 RepID=UPI003C31F8FF